MLVVLLYIFLALSIARVNTVEHTFEKASKDKSFCTLEEKIFTNEAWELEIPKINLKAQISYGTTKETMDKYIGHFDNTKYWSGNIGLAAHNRGYPVNYFGRLKELEIGDEIIYKTIFGIREYKVETVTIISDTDWSYLEDTNDNRITLITCVENEPSYRRCIQGIEI